MAKKNDAAFESFLADLKAINPAIEEVIKDEKVSAKLKEGVLARADYSSNMDALRSERESFAAEVAEAKSRISGWQKWYTDVTKEVATTQGKLKEYEELYGELDDKGKRQVAREAGMTKAEFETLLQAQINQRDLANLKFADDLTDIKLDYQSRFKDKLDTAAVFKVAGDRGIDLLTAYNFHISERVEEARSKDVEERIKREREEAVKEYASQHNLPVIPNTSDLSGRIHAADAKDVPNTPQSRIAAAMAGLNAARR